MEHLMEEAQVEGPRVEAVDGVNMAPAALDQPEWACLVTDRRRSNTSFWYPQPKQASSSAKVMNVNLCFIILLLCLNVQANVAIVVQEARP